LSDSIHYETAVCLKSHSVTFNIITKIVIVEEYYLKYWVWFVLIVYPVSHLTVLSLAASEQGLLKRLFAVRTFAAIHPCVKLLYLHVLHLLMQSLLPL